MDYERLQIFAKDHWIWQVHDNQCYLGRMIFVLDRPCKGDLSDLSLEELLSLMENIKLYKAFLSTLFSPDKWNFCQLGNEWPQLHIHVVPRYKSPRIWQNKLFIDKNWGKNYAPKWKSPLNNEEIYTFSDWLKLKLEYFISQSFLEEEDKTDNMTKKISWRI